MTAYRDAAAHRGEVASDISEQADKFVTYFSRLEPGDRGGAFRRWTRSKDFTPLVAQRIADEVARLSWARNGGRGGAEKETTRW